MNEFVLSIHDVLMCFEQNQNHEIYEQDQETFADMPEQSERIVSLWIIHVLLSSKSFIYNANERTSPCNPPPPLLIPTYIV